jgi:GEVED domain
MHTPFPPRAPRPPRRGDPEYKTKAQAAWKRCRAALLTAAFGLIAASSVQAQVSGYSFAVTTGTYTDLGASGTAITPVNRTTTLADNNEGTSAELPIGFNFTYNGSTFNRFMLNTNGFIKLGTAGMTAPSADALYPTSRTGSTGSVMASTDANNVNIISAGNTDWDAGTGVEYRYFTTGTVGSRTLTVQWKNVTDGWGNTQYLAANFQVILTEGTNTVQIKHGTWTISPNPPSTNAWVDTGAGLKGAVGNNRGLSRLSSTLSTSATATTSATSLWAFARPTGTATTGAQIPVVGTTYTFAPPAPVPRSISSLTGSHPFTTNVERSSINNVILRLDVGTAGNAGTLTLNSVTVSTPNTSTTVSGAKLWFSTSTTFSTTTATQLGSLQPISGGAATFSGLTQQFSAATSYLYVTFDIAGTATLGQTIDASVVDGDIVITADAGATSPGGQPQAEINPAGVRAIGYCSSAATSTGNTDIGRVRLNTLDNVPGGDLPFEVNSAATGTYTDFTAVAPTTLERGESYLLRVNAIDPSGATITAYLTAFIDFNQDGDFTDADEQVVVNTGTPSVIGGSLGAVTAADREAQVIITVPAGALLGNTRMRIVLSETAARAACESYTAGETEDYTVMIAPAPACPSLSGLSIDNVTNATAQVNFSFGTGGGTAQVEFGPTGFTPGSGTVISGLTASPYIITGRAANTSYDVYIRRDCGGSQSSRVGPVSFMTSKAPMDYAITRTAGITYNSIHNSSMAVPFSGTNIDTQLSDAMLFSDVALFPNGFTFHYPSAGTAGTGSLVTGMKISTNGFLTLDPSVTNTGTGNDFDLTTTPRVIAPLWEDLTGLSLDSIRYAVTGTPGAQTLTIEWINWKRFGVTGSSLNFQVKLYEGTDRIEFVYGLMSQIDGAGAASVYSYSLGLSGDPATEIASQQVENSAEFANLANDVLKRVPACNSMISFVPGTYVPTFAPSAMAPANDNCSGAIQLNIGADPADYFCTLYSSANATASPSIPVCSAATPGNPDDDVWFAFTVPAGPAKNITIRVAGTQGYNPILQLFSGTCGTLTAIDCQNATTTAGSTETIQAAALPGGATYYVRVYESGAGWGTVTSTYGGFAMDVYETPDPPLNDECAGAVTLTPNALCSTIVSGTTRGATGPTPSTGCAGTADDDVWYKFVATSNAIEISVAGIASFNAVIELMSGSCASLTNMLCASSTTSGTESLVRTGLSIGTTYYVRVYSLGALLTNRGNFTICARSFTVVANDECAGAISLPVNSACVTTNGTTVNSTGSNPTLTLCGITAVDDDVWYSFVAPASGAIRATVQGTGFNPALQLFSGACGSLTSVLCRNANTDGFESLTRINLVAGDTYYLRVHGAVTGEPSGAFTICVQGLTVPVNDEPAGAITLAVGPTGCVSPTLGTTVLATATTGIPVCTASTAGNPDDDVWYKFTPSITSPSITVSGATSFDAVVQLLQETTPGTFQEIFCEESTAGGAIEQLDATGLTPGQQYYVRVYGYGASTAVTSPGDFTICVSQQPKAVSTPRTATQLNSGDDIPRGRLNEAIIRVQLRVIGGVGSLPLQAITFRSNNSSDADLINNGVKLWISNQTAFDFNNATLLGTRNFNGSGDAAFSGLNYDLPSGNSYLYLTYSLKSTAGIGDTLDAQVLPNVVTIGGTDYALTTFNPSGIRRVGPLAPNNDEPCGAMTLPVQSNRPTFITATNVGATDSSPTIVGTCSGLTTALRDVFFKVTVPASGELNIDMRRPVGSTYGDSRLYLYDYTSCSGSLTVRGCDDDSGTDDLSSVRVTGLTPGASMLIRVALQTVTANPIGQFQIAVTDRPIFTGEVSNSPTVVGNFFPAREADLTTFLTTATITVPANAVNMPVLTASASLGGVAIQSGATLTQTAGTLTINGTFVNNGSFVTNAASSVALGTSGATPTMLGGTRSTTFENLTVGNSGVTLQGPAAVQVHRLLTLEGALTTNSQPLTLLSDASGTAMVVNAVGGSVIGPVRVQRWIDPSANPDLGYRHLAAPVTNTTIADLTVSSLPSFGPVVNPTYNNAPDPLVHGAVAPYPNVFDYSDDRVNNAFPVFERGYRSPNALTDPLESGRGYTVYMRGTVKPDFVGTLGNGNVAVQVQNTNGLANSGWNLLGNPYPSPMDWDLIPAGDLTAAGLNAQVSVFKSERPFTDGLDGVYLTRANGLGSLTNGLIPMAQGFFVRRSTVGTASLTLTNALRPTTYENPSHFRSSTTADLRPMVELALHQVGRTTPDLTTVYFEAGATPGADDRFDGFKLRSTGSMPSLFTRTAGGEDLAVNGLPAFDPTVTTVVPLGVEVAITGAYKLSLAALANLPADTRVLLRDMATGTSQDIRLNPTYAFTMDASFRSARFELVFSPASSPLGTGVALNSIGVQVYPNPVATGTELRIALTGLPTTVNAVRATLHDNLGRQVSQVALTTRAGVTEGSISTAGLAHGVYSLRLQAGTATVVRRVVVE